MAFYLIRGRYLYLYDKNLKQIGRLEFKKVYNSSSFMETKAGLIDKSNKVNYNEKTSNNTINESKNFINTSQQTNQTPSGSTSQ